MKEDSLLSLAWKKTIFLWAIFRTAAEVENTHWPSMHVSMNFICPFSQIYALSQKCEGHFQQIKIYSRFSQESTPPILASLIGSWLLRGANSQNPAGLPVLACWGHLSIIWHRYELGIAPTKEYGWGVGIFSLWAVNISKQWLITWRGKWENPSCQKFSTVTNGFSRSWSELCFC